MGVSKAHARLTNGKMERTRSFMQRRIDQRHRIPGKSRNSTFHCCEVVVANDAVDISGVDVPDVADVAEVADVADVADVTLPTFCCILDGMATFRSSS
tara:strand:- start:292 stop:585 length:294 start_codon:yes stop_codon:yes gene_type:complete